MFCKNKIWKSSVQFVLVCMISFIIIIIIACQVRCELETASFWLENPAHRSWLAGNDIIAGLPVMIRLSLQSHCFPSLHPPPPFSFQSALQRISVHLLRTTPIIHTLYLTIIHSASHFSVNQFQDLVCCIFCSVAMWKPLHAGTRLSTYSRQLDDIIARVWALPSPLPLHAASSGDHIQHTKPNAPLQFVWVGDPFSHKLCAYVSFTCVINYEYAIFSFALTRVSLIRH